MTTIQELADACSQATQQPPTGLGTVGRMVMPDKEDQKNWDLTGPIIIGADRNNPDIRKSHYYREATVFGERALYPMCGYGWNRSDGASFSILRGYWSAQGPCELCWKNVVADKPPVIWGMRHKTKWI